MVSVLLHPYPNLVVLMLGHLNLTSYYQYGYLSAPPSEWFQCCSQLSVNLGHFSHASSLAICATQPFLTALAVTSASSSLCYLWCSAISHVTFCSFSERVWLEKLHARAAYLNIQQQPFHFRALLFLNDIA